MGVAKEEELGWREAENDPTQISSFYTIQTPLPPLPHGQGLRGNRDTFFLASNNHGNGCHLALAPNLTTPAGTWLNRPRCWLECPHSAEPTGCRAWCWASPRTGRLISSGAHSPLPQAAGSRCRAPEVREPGASRPATAPGRARRSPSSDSCVHTLPPPLPQSRTCLYLQEP